MSRLAAALTFACALAAAQPCEAEVTRFAVLVGHNRGEADEANLLYAEADAAKMRDVLVDLGGFRHENVVLMQGENAVAVRQAIVAVNRRIRGLSEATQAVLLVYYSGHADAQDLHVGDSKFSLRELEQLVAGSAAAVRLLVVDSCRSGALTRVKGGHKGPAFAIKLDEQLASEGAIFLTSSSANEDAQESELLKGSFFTHYLVSGALGAADENVDGRVSLTEAYRYAYEHTLRASSRTLAGLQHPTFRYELSGHGDLTLTQLHAHRQRRSVLSFPEGRSYLVLQGDTDGAVVAEIGVRDQRRSVSVREGRYFIRGRGREHLLEGYVTVTAGQQHRVQDQELQRIAYARLVRKGAGDLRLVHGAHAAVRMRTALANSDGLCWGGLGGYELGLPSFTVGVRAGYCRAGFSNEYVQSSVDELGIDLRLGKAWDTSRVTVEPFVAVGAGVFRQRFTTRGRAPARTSVVGHLDAGLALRTELPRSAYLFVEVAAQTYWFRQSSTDDLATSVAVAAMSGVGFWL